MEKTTEFVLKAGKFRFPAQPLRNLVQLAFRAGSGLKLRNELGEKEHGISVNGNVVSLQEGILSFTKENHKYISTALNNTQKQLYNEETFDDICKMYLSIEKITD